MGLILDTNFLIVAQREANKGVAGKAAAFLSAHMGDELFVTFTVVAELACGKSMAAKKAWESLFAPYVVLPWSIEISWAYGEIYRDLAAKGTLIGTNDTWIAATAVTHGFAVVTNNVSEFSRV